MTNSETKMLSIGFGTFLSICIGGLALISLFVRFSQKEAKLVTVDVARVVRQASQQLMATYGDKEIPEAVREALVTRLREGVSAYATRHNVIVLDQGAVVAGEVKDVTEAVAATILEVGHGE